METADGKVIWRNDMQVNNNEPARIFVGDTGWTVVRTFFDQLQCFSPTGDLIGNITVPLAYLSEYVSGAIDESTYEKVRNDWGLRHAHYYFFPSTMNVISSCAHTGLIDWSSCLMRPAW